MQRKGGRANNHRRDNLYVSIARSRASKARVDKKKYIAIGNDFENSLSPCLSLLDISFIVS